MEIFTLTLKQMLMMFLLIIVGFVLRKKSILPDNAQVTMSKLETFLFVPALSLYAQMTKCNVKTFMENSSLLLYSLVLVLLAIALAYGLSVLFVRKAKGSPEREYQKNVYKYAMTFGNFGFMGNFIILGVFGEEMFFKYSLFTLVFSIACNSWGLFVLIPKDKSAGVLHNLKKGLLTPPVLALVGGIILGLTGVANYIPDFVVNAVNNASKCQGPVAMVLAGFVIGGYNLKELLLNKKVYVASIFRLVLIPAVFMVVLKLIGASYEIQLLSLICFATPLGLNTIVFPAAYGGETKTGASMAMISHVLSVITIPLMYLVFIVWL